MVRLVVTVTVCSAESHTVATLIIGFRLDKLVIVSVGSVVVEEFIASFQTAVPETAIFLAEPYMLDVGELGNLVRRIFYIRFIAVEQR